jgi:VIT1/CCC1 family predicted Fe2+/Mn2+ transporter
MDKSSLNSSEKKELRKEVREIKSELKASGNGVYFSVGAIIIIIPFIDLLL